MIALKIDLVYATKKEWMDEMNSYSLAGTQKTCDSKTQQQCTSADTMNCNANRECANQKNYCKSKGCSKRRLRQLSQIEANNLTGTDFNDMLAKYTKFNIKSTGAILDATDLESIAICTAGRYNYTEIGDPWYIDCNDYENAQCNINDYTYEKPKEGFCRTTGSPTSSHSPSTATKPPTSSPSPTWNYPDWTWSPTHTPWPTWHPTTSMSPSTTTKAPVCYLTY